MDKEKEMGEQLESLLQLLNMVGIEGDYEDICDTLEEYINEEEDSRKREELIASSPEYAQLEEKYRLLKKAQNEKIFSDDLREIRAEFDDCTAETIDDLGEVFCIARILGLSNIEAYRVICELNRRNSREIPVMGRVGSSRGDIKDFYSAEELRRLSKEDLDNPSILDRAIKSLTREHK